MNLAQKLTKLMNLEQEQFINEMVKNEGIKNKIEKYLNN